MYFASRIINSLSALKLKAAEKSTVCNINSLDLNVNGVLLRELKKIIDSQCWPTVA